jgi:hypothetical protein
MSTRVRGNIGQANPCLEHGAASRGDDAHVAGPAARPAAGVRYALFAGRRLVVGRRPTLGLGWGCVNCNLRLQKELWLPSVPKVIAESGAGEQRPQGDSNPCRRLEKPVSWASRRWGQRRRGIIEVVTDTVNFAWGHNAVACGSRLFALDGLSALRAAAADVAGQVVAAVVTVPGRERPPFTGPECCSPDERSDDRNPEWVSWRHSGSQRPLDGAPGY